MPSGAGLCSGGHPGARFGSNYSTDLKRLVFLSCRTVGYGANCWLGWRREGNKQREKG